MQRSFLGCNSSLGKYQLRNGSCHEVIEKIVMPAWIAGIQVRKDASGDVHVNLDSSTPCWNDGVEGLALEHFGLR
jgi:hypothetical protein